MIVHSVSSQCLFFYYRCCCLLQVKIHFIFLLFTLCVCVFFNIFSSRYPPISQPNQNMTCSQITTKHSFIHSFFHLIVIIIIIVSDNIYLVFFLFCFSFTKTFISFFVHIDSIRPFRCFSVFVSREKYLGKKNMILVGCVYISFGFVSVRFNFDFFFI